MTDYAAGAEKNSNSEEAGKSGGVQLSQEVTVMSSDGSQSTTELKEDGSRGKLRRAKGKGAGKFVSVNYQKMSTSPAECKQQ